MSAARLVPEDELLRYIVDAIRTKRPVAIGCAVMELLAASRDADRNAVALEHASSSTSREKVSPADADGDSGAEVAHGARRRTVPQLHCRSGTLRCTRLLQTWPPASPSSASASSSCPPQSCAAELTFPPSTPWKKPTGGIRFATSTRACGSFADIPQVGSR
jgi:hypothetical protein